MKASKKHSRRDIPYTDNLKVLPSGGGGGKKRTMCILKIKCIACAAVLLAVCMDSA